MRIDNYINRKVDFLLASENEEKSQAHKRSGKLSASRLGDPLQWQILYTMGVSEAPKDPYTLRKFRRGSDVEQRIISWIEPVSVNGFMEYRDVVGYYDTICDTSKWDFPSGIIPVEVKSVTNLKFKRIQVNGVQRGHQLQAAFYAVALNSSRYGVLYVASDDYRIHLEIHDTEAIRWQIDEIIDRFKSQKATGKVPVFKPDEVWQANRKYNRYLDWADLDEAGVEKKLAELS